MAEVGCGQAQAEACAAQGMTGATLLSVGPLELVDRIGITSLGARKRVVAGVGHLQRRHMADTSFDLPAVSPPPQMQMRVQALNASV